MVKLKSFTPKLWGKNRCPLIFFVVGEVPRQVGHPEGELHEADKSLVFLSSILSFLFFCDLSSIFSFCFWIFLIHPIQNLSVETREPRNVVRSPPLTALLLPRDLLLGEIPQNTIRNKKRGFNMNHEFGIPGDSEELPAWWGFNTGVVLGDLSIHPPATDPSWVLLHDGVGSTHGIVSTNTQNPDL